MALAKVLAQISFRGLDEDEVLDPGPALDDAIGVLERLQPRAFHVVQLIDDPAVTLEIMADFGGSTEKAVAWRTALVRAEGEAGFRSHFPGQSAARSGWVFAQLHLSQAALPSGLAFGLPTPHQGVEAEIARRLRLTTRGFGGAIFGVAREGAPELARALVRPLAQTEGAAGAAGEVAPALRAAMQVAAGAGWSVREGVCLSADADEASALMVENALKSHAARLYGFLPEDLREVDWGPLDAFDLPFDPAPAALQEAFAPLRPADYMARALRSLLTNARAASGRFAGAARAPAAPPSPAPGGGYAFLSYAHADTPAAFAIRDELARRGVRIWCDAALGAAQAWDEQLEARVRACAGVIACVSPAYARSRYCRRELKFADVLSKPILPISFDGAFRWSDGLEMRFQEYQILSARAAAWREDALEMLGRLAPACLERRPH